MDILLAERDLAMRRQLAGQLADLGWNVSEAADGIEALRLVAQRRFDCMAIDLRLARVSGFEVLKRARNEQPSAKRIALSRHNRSILSSVDPSLVDSLVASAALPSILGVATALAA